MAKGDRGVSFHGSGRTNYKSDVGKATVFPSFGNKVGINGELAKAAEKAAKQGTKK